MAIFQFMNDRIERLAPTSFRSAGVQERNDLQRLLRDQIDVIAPDILIISEEFGEWEDSKRRIDLLAACPDTCFDLDFVLGMVYSGLS